MTAERERADEALRLDVLHRREAEQRLVASERATRRLADEQAALRRIATLVAAEAAPSAVFEQVTTEVGQLLSVPSARVVRYEDATTRRRSSADGPRTRTSRDCPSARRCRSTATP